MSLGQRVVSTVGWTVGIKIGFQVVTWAMTLIVIRVLSPDDYGLMAISQVFINLLAGFANLGLGDALIQREDTPKPLVASVFGVMLLVSSVFMVLLALAAYPIAGWYHDARLVPLIQISSLGFLFHGLMTLPRVFLLKHLRVRAMFVTELSSGVIGSALIVLLAYAGYGVWSLVLGGLAMSVIKLAGLLVLTAEYFVWPRLEFGLVRPLYGFGAFRVLEYMAWITFVSADTLILGRWLGPGDLGVYTVAMNFAGMPLSKIAPIINAVAFPAFAMVQTQPAEARFYAMKAMRLMAMVAVPVFFGISAIAPEVVTLVFGPQWAAAEPILAVLSLAIVFRAILLVLPNFLQGIGNARAAFWCTATGAVLFPPAFLIGCHWGVIGVCYAWLAGYPCMFAINAWIASRTGHLDMRSVLAIPLRPMLAGAAMLAAIAALRPYLPAGPELVRVALLILAGAAVYGGVMLLAFRTLVLEGLAVANIRRSRPA